MTTPHRKKHHRIRPEDAYRLRDDLDAATAPVPVGPTADVYRIAGYTKDLIGTKKPECDILPPKWDSGLTWPDPNNPQPTDLLWGGGVDGGLWWDGTLYRDVVRYPAGGQLCWCSYFKPGSSPGIKNGYWINFGHSFSHLHNDDPAQILTGASQRLYWDVGRVTPHGTVGGTSAGSGDPAYNSGQWELVIEATQYVTAAVVEVWRGSKPAGNDPTGEYTRIAGCDPTLTLAVEAH